MIRASSFLLFALVLLVPISFAAISVMTVSGQLDQSGVATLIIASELSDSQGKQIYLNLSHDVDSVVVKDRSGLQLGSTVKQVGNYTLIYATVPTDYVEFDISSDSFTSKAGSDWMFDLGISSSEDVGVFNATIAFPDGTALRSTNGMVENDGNTLSVTWSGTNMSQGDRARIQAGYFVSQTSDSMLPFLVLGAVAIILLAVFSYTRSHKESPAVPSPALESSLFKTLDETDKEIIREISAQNGRTTQAHLFLNTHIPKATLSRRLASLENRGLITRSQKGNRNLVTLGGALK